jgi:hypothetical protein
MKNHPENFGKEMPRWAQSFCVFAGVVLLVLGSLAVFAIRPIHLDVLILVIIALGLSADFLQGAVYRRWLVLINFWL